MVTLDEWRRGGGFFEWRGQRVFFRAEGAGEPLLLIHGFPTASWDWTRVWPELVKRYRVMTLDMIGFGFSAKPRDWNYSLSIQTDLFEALLEREKVTQYRMVAHDMGDSVAQELLARQRGDAKAKIVAAGVLNGGLFPEAHHPVVAQKLLASPVGVPGVARLTTCWVLARGLDGGGVVAAARGEDARGRGRATRDVEPGDGEPGCARDAAADWVYRRAQEESRSLGWGDRESAVPGAADQWAVGSGCRCGH